MNKKTLAITAIAIAVVAVGMGNVVAKSLGERVEGAIPVDENETKITDTVGLYAPIFEIETAEAIKAYKEANGDVVIIEYKDYTILSPEGKEFAEAIENAKSSVDQKIESQEAMTPSAEQQERDIAQIRFLFETDGKINYSKVGKRYNDEKGSQYLFMNGKLVAKQVGVSRKEIQEWKKAHSYYADENAKPQLTTDEAKQIADELIINVYGERAKDLIEKVATGTLNNGMKATFDYAPENKDISILVAVERMRGEIINYNDEGEGSRTIYYEDFCCTVGCCHGSWWWFQPRNRLCWKSYYTWNLESGVDSYINTSTILSHGCTIHPLHSFVAAPAVYIPSPDALQTSHARYYCNSEYLGEVDQYDTFGWATLTDATWWQWSSLRMPDTTGETSLTKHVDWDKYRLPCDEPWE